MTEQTITPVGSDEQQIMTILHNLPPERRLQVLAFARFVAFETFQTTAPGFPDFTISDSPSDARWDELLASEEGQMALDRLADEALAEIRAGNAKSIRFTEDGEIAPQ